MSNSVSNFTTTLNASSRDARVDWLRGLAALLILSHHLFAPIIWSAHRSLALLSDLAGWAWLGVPIFFVLSGRCVGATWLRSASAPEFARRRARRIFPPYFASLAVCLGVVLIRKIAIGSNDVAPLPASLPAIFATLTLATVPVTAVPAINWVYWSLSYEVAFYAVLSLLIFFPGNRARVWLGAHALLCALDVAGVARPGTPGFFLDQWPLFGLGLGLAFRAAGRTEARVSFVISALHLTALAGLGRIGAIHLVGLGTAALLILPAARWRPGGDDVLPRIGEISYSLYLIHVPIGIHLILLPAYRFFGPGAGGLYLALGLGAVGSLVAGLLFHRWAERPWLSTALQLPAPP